MTPNEMTKRAASELSVAELLGQVQRVGQPIAVEAFDRPDGARVYVLRPIIRSPERRTPATPPHRYVPAWVWAAGLLLAAAVVAAGVWLVHAIVVAAEAHAGQIATVALVAVMALSGGGCCLAAAAKGHRH